MSTHPKKGRYPWSQNRVVTNQQGKLHRWKLLNTFGGLVDQSTYQFTSKTQALLAGRAAKAKERE